mgnify:CR=1 FL=1
MATAAARTRDRERVENDLIEAAADLLGELGPRALTVRMVAERAGVNHGLIHHYFGGKQPLLAAAMRRLVEQHEEFATARAGGSAIPAPLALGDDPRYLRAVLRCVLDGEMGLARTELDAGVSVPRRALDHITARRGQKSADLDTKAEVGMEMALEMGWVALEPFILAVLDVAPGDREAIRERVRQRRGTRVSVRT